MRSVPPADLDYRHLEQNVLHYWHQGWEVFPGVRTPGRSPVDYVLDKAGVPKRLDGLRVADIGAWNGCTAFECERRGAADVTAISLEDPDSTGFNFLKGVLESNVRYVRGSIYNLDPTQLGIFDVVICFGVIYHLRYPMLGLDNLRRVAKGHLYLESHVLDEAFHDLAGANAEMPLVRLDRRLPGGSLLQFYKGKELAGDETNWFAPSMSFIRHALETAGFDILAENKAQQRGYLSATVRSGMPPFLDRADGMETYESQYYDLNFRHLFGDPENWRR